MVKVAVVSPQYFDDGPVAPDGEKQAVCVAVSEPFTYMSQYGEKKAIRITWEIADRDPETSKRYRISKRYNVKSDGESVSISDWTQPPPQNVKEHALTVDLRKWGPKLSPGDDLTALVGQGCRLFIEHTPKRNGGHFADVTSVVALRPGTKVLPLVDNHDNRESTTKENLPF